MSSEDLVELVLHDVSVYNADAVIFYDDNFFAPEAYGESRAAPFADQIIALKAAGRLPAQLLFHCKARINEFLTDNGAGPPAIKVELMRLLKKAGFSVLSLGVETFVDRLRRAPSVNKGMTAEDCRRVIYAMLEAHLAPQINIILGIPDATLDEVLISADAAVAFAAAGGQVSIIPRLCANNGAPITRKKQYPILSETFLHPRTGRKVRFGGVYVPADPAVAEAIEKTISLQPSQLACLRQKAPHPGSVPRSFLGMSYLTALCQAIGDMRRLQDYTNVIDGLNVRSFSLRDGRNGHGEI